MEPKRGVTLGTLAAIAHGLYRWRLALALLGAASAVWFLAVIADPDAAGEAGLLPLAVLMWSGLGLGIGWTLPRLPAAVGPDDGFGQRLRKRLLLGIYGLGALLMLGLALFSLWLTWRALGL